MSRNVLLAVLSLIVILGGGRAEAARPGVRWKSGAFPIRKATPQKGWAAKTMTPAKWKPIRQANLADQLKNAPALRYLIVGPAPERCWSGAKPYLVPNPDGKSWDTLYPYYNKYRGEQEVVIHDFGADKTTSQVLSTGKGRSVLTKEAIGFHMQPSYYTAGKLVFSMYGPVIFVVYDPAVNKFVHGAKPFGDAVINGRCVLGADGMIYGVGWDKGKTGFVAYSFDPRTYKAKRSKAFGPPNEHRTELYRHVVKFGDWIYAAVGNRPWHLVAFNFKTGQGRLLATTKDILGSSGTIRMTRMEGGLSGQIREAVSVSGVKDVDQKEFRFWLHDGEILKRDDDIPPWSKAPAKQKARPRYSWAREFQVWPDGFKSPSPPPIIKNDSGKPGPGGQVELQYQPGGQEDWATLKYTVKMYPGEVQRLTEVNDQVLFATDSGYGEQVFYNIKMRSLMRVGGTLSPYSMGLYANRLYVSGYPTSQMFEYDFTRAIGLKQEEPNPKRVAWIGKKDDTHCPLGGTLGAADGRVYNAGCTYGRQRNGGGFGWYDTKTGETGGMSLDTHRVFWMTTAANGRYLLLSTKQQGKGMLLCWDTQKHEFIYKKSILNTGTPGPIVEAFPGGLVIGHAPLEGERGVLYGLRADTGDVLWRKDVPVPPITAFSQIRRHAYAFRRGPRGYIWSFFGNTLVRINPLNAKIEPVGIVPDGPAQIAFLGGRIYIAGGPYLRCLAISTAPRR